MNAPIPASAVACASLPLADICASPTNPRKHFDATYLAELAETIKVHGILQPITVRPNPKGAPTYELVVGECRWRAAQIAGLQEIPAFWRELDDREVLEIQIVENLQRRDVHPIEEAEGYELLMKRHGYNAEQIAEKIGKSRSYVYARLKLTALCATAREACYEGQLETSTALLIARIPGARLQDKALARILEGRSGAYGVMSYRDAKHYIRHSFTVHLQPAPFDLRDARLLPEAGSCEACPKRSGNCPEICTDLDGDADVCTDTECFNRKKDARRLQLLDRAAERNVPVLEEVTAALRWDGAHDGKAYAKLDDVVDGDGQERTYRQILGDAAPVSFVANMGHGDQKNYVEMGEATALAEALAKAGWQRSEPTPEEDGADSGPDADAQREATRQREADRQRHETERAARQLAREQEMTWHKTLRDTISGRLQTECNAGDLNTDPIIRALAIAWLRQEVELAGMPDDVLAQGWGFTLPDDYEEDTLTGEICAQIEKWPVGTALAFLFSALNVYSLQGYTFEAGDKPHGLLAMARAIDLFDPEGLRPGVAEIPEKGDVAIEAAPAEEEDDEEEEDPAPASPATGKTSCAVAYRHPDNGMTWSGRGMKPKWVRDWLANGHAIDELLV